MVTGDAISDELLNASGDILVGIGEVGRWMQAIGLIIILWLIFSLINLWLNRKKWKKLEEFERKIIGIESKINKLLIRK